MLDNGMASTRLEKASLASEGRSSGISGSRLIARVARCVRERDLRLQLMLLAFMLSWYGAILVHFSPDAKLDLTFNSMLSHLLHWQFDVDPGVVGSEGFLRNGHTYAYWGIWCALLRLPLWIVGRMNIDITAWSCLAAVCLAAMAKVHTVLLVRRHGAQDRIAKHAVEMMLAYIVLGGSEIGYLKVSIYQEVVFWGVAFAAVFVYFAVKGLIIQRFDLSTLSAMALCAGLALLTRVSTGIGLILAFGLLLVVLAWQSSQTILGEDGLAIRKRLKPLLHQRILVPVGILTVFVAVTGIVNYCRWGNPLTFANFNLHLLTRVYTDRIPRLAKYGTFNLRRIPFGLAYYFAPAWAVTTSGGHFLFEQTQVRLFEDVELPPSSFLLTDMLPLCFILFLIVALWKNRHGKLEPVTQWAAIAAGLSAPCFLMLTAISMTYRYRMEFYPEMDFLAFLGLYILLANEELRAQYARRRVLMEAAMIVSVLASFAALFLYLNAPFGPAQIYLYQGTLHGRHFIWF
jgi:hypothetical protein